MSKFKSAMLYLIPAFLVLVIPAFSIYSDQPGIDTFIPPENPDIIGTFPSLPELTQELTPMPPVKPNPAYPVEAVGKFKIPSSNSLWFISGNKSAIGKPSELAKTIIITKIIPSIGEIILNNTNETMPVNLSGCCLVILSINYPKKEVISNRSVIAPMGQIVVTVSSLDDSAVAILMDSTGKTVDKVPYSGNWTRS